MGTMMARLSLTVVVQLLWFVGPVYPVPVPVGTAKAPILVCHAPLELKIFADASYHATSANLKPCDDIVLSSAYALFSSDLTPAAKAEKRNLQLLMQQTPDAEFCFGLRSAHISQPYAHLRTVFKDTKVQAALVDFVRTNKLKGFDLSWGLIQSTPDYLSLLKSIKNALSKEGFLLTVTIGVEVDDTTASHVINIASVVDRIHLVPASNRHYGAGRYPMSRELEQAFDSLEVNEGKFLALYGPLVSRRKIVVGLSPQSIVWKANGDVSNVPIANLQQRKILIELESYDQSCKEYENSWKPMPIQPSPFYRLALAPSRDQWMVHVNPSTFASRVGLLKHYGFAGVAVYDYYQDDFAGQCSVTSGAASLYPMIHQAGVTLHTNPSFPNIDANASVLCIPFLGLISGCQGAFNYGTAPNLYFTVPAGGQTVTTVAWPPTSRATTSAPVTTQSPMTTRTTTVTATATGPAVAAPESRMASGTDQLVVRNRRSSIAPENSVTETTTDLIPGSTTAASGSVAGFKSRMAAPDLETDSVRLEFADLMLGGALADIFLTTGIPTTTPVSTTSTTSPIVTTTEGATTTRLVSSTADILRSGHLHPSGSSDPVSVTSDAARQTTQVFTTGRTLEPVDTISGDFQRTNPDISNSFHSNAVATGNPTNLPSVDLTESSLVDAAAQTSEKPSLLMAQGEQNFIVTSGALTLDKDPAEKASAQLDDERHSPPETGSTTTSSVSAEEDGPSPSSPAIRNDNLQADGSLPEEWLHVAVSAPLGQLDSANKSDLFSTFDGAAVVPIDNWTGTTLTTLSDEIAEVSRSFQSTSAADVSRGQEANGSSIDGGPSVGWLTSTTAHPSPSVDPRFSPTSSTEEGVDQQAPPSTTELVNMFWLNMTNRFSPSFDDTTDHITTRSLQNGTEEFEQNSVTDWPTTTSSPLGLTDDSARASTISSEAEDERQPYATGWLYVTNQPFTGLSDGTRETPTNPPEEDAGRHPIADSTSPTINLSVDESDDPTLSMSTATAEPIDLWLNATGPSFYGLHSSTDQPSSSLDRNPSPNGPSIEEATLSLEDELSAPNDEVSEDGFKGQLATEPWYIVTDRPLEGGGTFTVSSPTFMTPNTFSAATDAGEINPPPHSVEFSNEAFTEQPVDGWLNSTNRPTLPEAEGTSWASADEELSVSSTVTVRNEFATEKLPSGWLNTTDGPNTALHSTPDETLTADFSSGPSYSASTDLHSSDGLNDIEGPSLVELIPSLEVDSIPPADHSSFAPETLGNWVSTTGIHPEEMSEGSSNELSAVLPTLSSWSTLLTDSVVSTSASLQSSPLTLTPLTSTSTIDIGQTATISTRSPAPATESTASWLNGSGEEPIEPAALVETGKGNPTEVEKTSEKSGVATSAPSVWEVEWTTATINKDEYDVLHQHLVGNSSDATSASDSAIQNPPNGHVDVFSLVSAALQELGHLKIDHLGVIDWCGTPTVAFPALKLLVCTQDGRESDLLERMQRLWPSVVTNLTETLLNVESDDSKTQTEWIDAWASTTHWPTASDLSDVVWETTRSADVTAATEGSPTVMAETDGNGTRLDSPAGPTVATEAVDTAAPLLTTLAADTATERSEHPRSTSLPIKWNMINIRDSIRALQRPSQPDLNYIASIGRLWRAVLDNLVVVRTPDQHPLVRHRVSDRAIRPASDSH